MNALNNHLVVAIVVGSIIASLIGTIIGSPTIIEGWLGSVIMHAVLVLLSLVPILISIGVLSLIAKAEKKSPSIRSMWYPGLLYIPLALFTGKIMGDAFEMPLHGESGSEFIPLLVGGLWFYAAIAVGVLAFIVGFVVLVKTPKTINSDQIRSINK